MTLATTLAIYLGVLIECLWLWDFSEENNNDSTQSQVRAPGLSKPMFIMGIAGSAGLILILISAWAGETPVTNFLNFQLQYVLMGVTMISFLLIGAVGGWLVPRVSEYNIVSVLAIVSFNTFMYIEIRDLLLTGFFLGIALILSFILVFKRSPFSNSVKLAYYLLYLGTLVFLTLQGGVVESMRQSNFTISEAFLFGSMFTFLALHVLFGLRFLVITTSFVLPSNRVYIKPMVQRLFIDDQIKPLPFFLSLFLVLIVVFLNDYFQLFPNETFAGVMIIISVQYLFRPKKRLILV